tara:strand:- start:1299 stop:2204 length:906 start_codon:yes stop_codon:yes gene_type:complete
MCTYENYKSAYVAILGLPNAGKSTLLNSLVEKELCITSERPQTTRNSILGIRHSEHYQMLFLDTPGWHQGKLKIDHFFRNQVEQSILDADLILFVIDARHPKIEKNRKFLEFLTNKSKKTIILVLTKIDTVKQSALIEIMHNLHSEFKKIKELIPVSAQKPQNIDCLVDLLLDNMSSGPPYYPPDCFTDKSTSFLLGEFAREYLFRNLDQEVPFSCATVVEEFKESENQIEAQISIYVERKGQKLILLGPAGALIREIKSKTIQKARKFFKKKISLQIWVKVKAKWRQDATILSQIGYKLG